MAEQRIFTARDDRFHSDEMVGDWWSTETAWFSFAHPERRLGGWLYTLARPNIGTVAGGAWVWDDSAHLPWEVLYSANYTALELPRDQDLNDITLPTGVSIRVIEPCMSYALGYSDAARLQATLRFEGVMPPEPLTSTGSTFGRSHHFDQIGRVSGEIILHGETIPIDCLAVARPHLGPAARGPPAPGGLCHRGGHGPARLSGRHQRGGRPESRRVWLSPPRRPDATPDAGRAPG